MVQHPSLVSQKGSHLRFFGLTLLLAILLVAVSTPTINAQSADNFCAAGELPQFRLGFATFKEQMGATVGEPLECEHYDEQGNAYQKTTTGLLFYNKGTGQITFTPNPTVSMVSSDNFCAVGEPEFRFGFAELKRQLGAVIGEPIECEHYDEQGNAYQKTTTGELYHHKSSGRTIFTPNGPQAGAAVTPPTANPSAGSASAASAPANCSLVATTSNAEGPFYTPNAPFKDVLVEPGMAGTRLLLTGRVLTTDCQPVAGALLDFWQTDNNGNYDNSGYSLRGKLYADAEGNYRLETIMPGLYPGRPQHIHVKVSQPDGRVLTTQIYFENTPDNQSDSLYNPSLTASLSNAADGSQRATFDFVLAP